jgi:hypothetical protein
VLVARYHLSGVVQVAAGDAFAEVQERLRVRQSDLQVAGAVQREALPAQPEQVACVLGCALPSVGGEVSVAAAFQTAELLGGVAEVGVPSPAGAKVMSGLMLTRVSSGGVNPTSARVGSA